MCVIVIVADIHRKVQMTTQKIKKKSWIKIKFMNVTAFNLTLIVYLNIFIFKYTLFNIMVEKYKKNHFKYQ